MSVKVSGNVPAKLKEVRREELGISQSEAARRIGVSESAYRNWESGRNEPSLPLQEVLQEMREGLPSTDRQRDPIYPTVASQGDGSFEIAEKAIGYIEGEDAMSRPGRDVFWMPVRGDSMKDTLSKGGLVPVQKLEPTWKQELREDDVYLFRLEGAIQIKRLQRRPDGRIRVVSDNEHYEDFDVTLDDGTDFEILGRVLV
jgi:phage repressor protein C with HTH and peptisase S24 domain